MAPMTRARSGEDRIANDLMANYIGAEGYTDSSIYVAKALETGSTTAAEAKAATTSINH